MSFEYDPPTGLLDTSVYPDVPASPTAARQQFMDLFYQARDQIGNLSKYNTINALLPFPTTLTACKGDGVTDDSTALQSLLNYCDANGANLYLPKGVYCASSILTTSGKFTIQGDRGYSIIKATAIMTDLLVIDKDNTNLVLNNAYRTGQLVGICLDGNSKANNSLNIKKGKGINVKECEIKRPLVSSCVIGTDSSNPTWEVIFDDVILDATNATGQAQYGLLINQISDSWFEKLLIINGSTNWINYAGASTTFHNVHGYAYPETLAPDIGMNINTSGVTNMSDIVCDTTKRVGMKVVGNGVKLNRLMTSLKTGYIDTGTGDICSLLISGSQHTIDNIEISMTDATKQSRTSVVIFDNTSPVVTDFYCGYVMGFVASNIAADLKVMGALPTRFRFGGGTQATSSFTDSNTQFLFKAIGNGQTTASFTFKNARPSIIYNVLVNVAWNTSWWITNQTVNGFTVNFGTPPTSTQIININVPLS